MPLPELNELGDLPVGVHRATLAEVVARFGQGSLQRQLVTNRLLRIYELAQATGKLLRCVIFGSYVTSKPNPNDVDIILIMQDDLNEQDYDPDVFPMFDHLRAQRELGASLFAIRPGFIVGEPVDQFIAYWQIKRDLSQHGIVEVIERQQP